MKSPRLVVALALTVRAGCGFRQRHLVRDVRVAIDRDEQSRVDADARPEDC